jgi:hypothetical protein
LQQIKISMKPKVHDTSSSELVKQYQKINFKFMSRKILLALFLLTNLSIFAQKPCEIDANITDSVGIYKSTKQSMIFERSFAGNSTNIFFALTNTNGVLGMETQQVQSSYDFIKANCFDANSRIYIQTNSGKIITLFFVGIETCGTLVRNDNNQNVRITTGSFVFSKENFEELKVSPVTYIRIKYAGETLDYPFKTRFVSVLDKTMYEPEKYFMNTIRCIDSN